MRLYDFILVSESNIRLHCFRLYFRNINSKSKNYIHGTTYEMMKIHLVN